jgi:hypothetical protein
MSIASGPGQREGLPNISLSDVSLRVVIREPQVYFRGNGQMVVPGHGKASGQRQPLRLVFAPRTVEGSCSSTLWKVTWAPSLYPSRWSLRSAKAWPGPSWLVRNAWRSLRSALATAR